MSLERWIKRMAASHTGGLAKFETVCNDLLHNFLFLTDQ
jgi:hypothetical protein